MTSFVELIYRGKYAGHMVKFILSECLFVPSLFDLWKDKSTGEVIVSFAIFTSDLPNYVAQAGHDRSPIFFNQNDVIHAKAGIHITQNKYFDLTFRFL